MEVLEDIRNEMSREAEYDVLTLTEIIKNGRKSNEAMRQSETEIPEEEQTSKDQRPKNTDRNLIYGNRI